MKFKTIVTLTLIVCSSIFLYENLIAYSRGITGTITFNKGCACHALFTTESVRVTISGPASVEAGDTATYRLKLFGGPLIAGGFNIGAEFGSLDVSYLEPNTQLIGSELTHTSPKLSISGDTISWFFKYKAPNTPGTGDTIYANGNSVNLNGNYTGDAWNYGTNFTVNVTPSTSIIKNEEIAKEYKLSQNYPNPFNPSTKINFSILKSGFVSLKLYDNLGRLTANLVNENLTAGNYDIIIDVTAYGLTSGMYYYRLESNSFSETKKMILAK